MQQLLLLVVFYVCVVSSCLGFVGRTARKSPALAKSSALAQDLAWSQVSARTSCLRMSSEETEVEPVPTFLPSERGVDYIPLATLLATGDFKTADQFTRDNLIKIAGPGAVKRGFVYWTEVASLPEKDLCTMERLWLQYSDGNFGYSVQKRVWDVENANFDSFIRRIGWTKVENGSERKLKWFGQSEFLYTVEGAPKGHLPLTSALRGTQLMKKLMDHPVWTKYDWKNYKSLKWD